MRLWLYYMLEAIWLYHENMQILENKHVFEILITQKLLKCPKDPFVRSAFICFLAHIVSYLDQSMPAVLRRQQFALNDKVLLLYHWANFKRILMRQKIVTRGRDFSHNKNFEDFLLWNRW